MYSGYGNGASLVDSIVESLQGTYREHMRVKRDVANCLHMYDELHPIADTVSMDGISRRLLVLSGTIPINYMQQIYNFPIEIVVPEAYPFKQPRFRVTPTGTLRIKPRHRHVDEQGIVFHPYLSSWNPTQSNLAEMVLQVAMEFGNDPPLYSQAAAPPPPIISSSSNGGRAGVPRPPYQTQVPPPVYQQKPPPPPPLSTTTSSVPKPPIASSSSSAFQNVPPPPIQSIQPTIAVVRTRVTDKLKLRCNNALPKMQQELQTELENSEKLERNGEEMKARLDQLKALEQQLMHQIDEVSTKSAELQSILAMQKDQRDQMQANLDEYVQPADAQTKQLFQCVAETLTIDDVLYHLNSALIRQRIDLKTFLKQARALSREQFLKIALAKKIYQEQTTPEVNGPAADLLRPKSAGKGSSSGAYPSIPSSHYPSVRPPSYNGYTQ